MTAATPEAFEAAIRAKDASGVAAMLDAAPGLATAPLQGGLSPLLLAAYHRADEVQDVLLARGVPVSIHEAAAMGIPPRVRAHLAADPASVNAVSADGWTPLHLAAHFGRWVIAGLLLDNGADVNARSRNMLANQPLHAAIAGGSPRLAQFLVQRGADVNARFSGGAAALHLAAAVGSVQAAEMLLANGADMGLRDEAGRTPLAVAIERGQPEVADLLRARGGVA